MQTAASNKRPPRRLWRALGAGLALLALPMLLLGGLRLYFNDARLTSLARQALHERLGAEVGLGDLRLSLWDGIELSQLRIGPLPQFTQETLWIERLAIHWQLSALLHGSIVLPEVACTGVRAALEENVHGTNFAAAFRALHGAPSAAATGQSAEPTPPTPRTPQASLETLRLPVPVRLERLAVQVQEARIERPNQRARLTHLQAVGNLAGEGTAITARLWAGLGDPNGATLSSLHLETDAPAQSLEVSQKLGLTLESTGLGDLRLALDWQADVSGAHAGHALAPMRLDAALQMDADLLAQTVRLPRCQLTFSAPVTPPASHVGGPTPLAPGRTSGSAASLDLAAAASHLLGTPELELQRLRGEAHLDILQPYLAPWVPGLQLGGLVRLQLAPLQGSLPALQASNGLTAAANVSTEALSVSLGALAATGLDSETRLSAQGGTATAQGQLALAHAAHGSIGAQGVRLEFTASTPLGPWLDAGGAGGLSGTPAVPNNPQSAGVGSPAGSAGTQPTAREPQVAGQATLRVAQSQGPGFSAQGTWVDVQVQAPIAVLKHSEAAFAAAGPGPSALPNSGAGEQSPVGAQAGKARASTKPAPASDTGQPVQVTLRGGLTRAGAGTNAVRDLRYSAQLSAWDLAGARADVQLRAQAARAEADALRIPQVAVRVDAQRRADCYLLRELQVTAAQNWRFTLAGAVDDATTPTPHFRQLRAVVEPLSIGQAVAALPPSMQPAGSFAGTFSAAAELDGVVPYRELLAHSRPPSLATPDDPAWGRSLRATAAWLQGWVDRLDAGLPFTAGLRLELRDTQVALQDLQLSGLELTADLQARAHGPALSVDVNLPRANGPTPVQGLRTHLEAAVDGGDWSLHGDTRMAQVDLAGQATPLQDLRLSGALDYTWGGDLRLHELLGAAANRGVKLTAEGVVAQPLDVAMGRAWERTGLPGMEARVAWALGVHAPQEERLDQAGMTFAGGLDVAGEVRLADGELGLTGELRADHVHMESGTTLIEQLNGGLPFEVRLVFGTRDDATPVHRGLGFGGGTLALVTAEEDVRNRPARPVYYDRLRPYRPGVGLSALRVQSGPYELVDFALEGRIADGMLLADWISMHLLGGDVVGNLALQLGRDAAVRADMALKVSNMDASYLPALKLKPGPDSELSADMRVSFLAAEQGRDLSANMNVTKIGAKALDRFLQLLDPEAQDAKLQDTRKNLRFVRIQQVALWMRYENLNMDLSYDPILAIPFTQIGYRPIERELLRRYALGEFLDLYLQPYIDAKLAPALGWTHGHT